MTPRSVGAFSSQLLKCLEHFFRHDTSPRARALPIQNRFDSAKLIIPYGSPYRRGTKPNIPRESVDSGYCSGLSISCDPQEQLRPEYFLDVPRAIRCHRPESFDVRMRNCEIEKGWHRLLAFLPSRDQPFNSCSGGRGCFDLGVAFWQHERRAFSPLTHPRQVAGQAGRSDDVSIDYGQAVETRWFPTYYSSRQ